MTVFLGVVVGLYLLGILALSIYAGRRVTDEEDYVVAGRRLPLGLAWGTLLATWFGAATLLGAAEAARNEGVRGTILDPFASGFALVIAGLFFAKPLWEMRLLTMADFYRRKFGRRAEFVASLILVPGYFGWVAAQLIALAGIGEAFFGITPAIGIFAAAGIVLVYTFFGGMWSVTLTDTFQIVVVLVTVVVLAGVTFSHLGDGSVLGGVDRLLGATPRDALNPLPTAGTAAIVAWVATWGSGLFGNIPGQDLMQRVFASRDSSTAARACILAGVVYVSFGLMPVGLGLASRILMPGQEQPQILGVLASQFLTPTLTVVFVVSLISIIISTCTSAILSPATILGHNLLGHLPAFRLRGLFVERLSVVIVTAASLAVAFSGRTILELLELSLSTVLVALFVPLVAGLFGRPRGELPAILAMGLGILMWLGRELFEGVFVPMPAELADAGLHYAEYIARAFPADRVGPVLAVAAYAFALIPSAISGTLASLLGYAAGERVIRRSASVPEVS